ncbi:DoxX family membrane protein [Yeosuana sp.]|uniref:DoxX family membrane protein n=1 Tax=Yeosuana sp. TaxID=2529388 RepID=UPI004054AF5D|tara:strand:- start:638 stop:1012 length:375 start_codon:yes stop_codon:yes gene_type:complete
MNSKVFMVLRILLGLMLLVFGLNKFLHYLPQPEMSADAGAFFGAIMSTKTLMLVGIVEVVSGLAFLFNKYGALMAIILMSVSVNIILFHVSLNPEGIGPGVVVFLLNIVMLYAYRDKYKDLLAG